MLGAPAHPVQLHAWQTALPGANPFLKEVSNCCGRVGGGLADRDQNCVKDAAK